MLYDFIHTFMFNHLNAFLSLKEEASLCSLRSFSTNNWNPDYSNALHREFYYLKYASAYMVEYTLAYRTIFMSDWLLNEPSVKVLSLGCGAMLDLVGCTFGLRTTAHQDKTLAYSGVDVVNWQCPETRLVSNCNFAMQGVEDYQPNTSEEGTNIITFPKSISDISNAKIRSFASNLQNTHLAKRLCVVNAKRGNSFNDKEDAEAFCAYLAKRFGYVVRHRRCVQGVKGVPFSHWFNKKPFRFLPAVIREFQDLAYTRLECDCKKRNICAATLGRYPIMYSQHMSTDIYYLEKACA